MLLLPSSKENSWDWHRITLHVRRIGPDGCYVVGFADPGLNDC